MTGWAPLLDALCRMLVLGVAGGTSAGDSGSPAVFVVVTVAVLSEADMDACVVAVAKAKLLSAIFGILFLGGDRSLAGAWAPFLGGDDDFNLLIFLTT